ncbi:TetR/AcrR family transcriptional regulator [Duganella callida]|uniref:TetR/AcrR family transcriptional regulator n=1 Tax=Duganella callida TaxID=2561932 RepID=A0A4Y9SC89_9BURK|nr:TetR/AcrR family transcriptional regulator [Duganella callida]TFW19967.1 TetR/AcrR family transcriptional regulator [Duganella callida]
MGDEHPLAGGGARKLRTDGAQARERVLLAALQLFVARGYHNTSVREIAAQADVNSASIRYYFGDKAGLYRAALYEPVREHLSDERAPFDAPGLSLEQALRRYTRKRLLPLGGGELILLSVRLRMRESFEPTGLLDDESLKREQEQRLLQLLARALDVPQGDAELAALGYSIRALTAYPYLSREQICRADPALFATPGALEVWVTRLTSYACAMVEAERQRRR